MSAYLKRQCLFEVSIGAFSEPESYEDNIDWLNNCNRDYGIICLEMSPNIHHLIDSTEYPFEIWKKLEKLLVCRKYKMKHGVNPTSPHVLSLEISCPVHYLMKLVVMNMFLIQFMLFLPSLIRMLLLQ